MSGHIGGGPPIPPGDAVTMADTIPNAATGRALVVFRDEVGAGLSAAEAGQQGLDLLAFGLGQPVAVLASASRALSC